MSTLSHCFSGSFVLKLMVIDHKASAGLMWKKMSRKSFPNLADLLFILRLPFFSLKKWLPSWFSVNENQTNFSLFEENPNNSDDHAPGLKQDLKTHHLVPFFHQEISWFGDCFANNPQTFDINHDSEQLICGIIDVNKLFLSKDGVWIWFHKSDSEFFWKSLLKLSDWQIVKFDYTLLSL